MIGSFSILEITKAELIAVNGNDAVIEKLKMMIDSLNEEFISSLKDSLLYDKQIIEVKLRISSDSLMGKIEPLISGRAIYVDRSKSLLRIDLLKEELE